MVFIIDDVQVFGYEVMIEIVGLFSFEYEDWWLILLLFVGVFEFDDIVVSVFLFGDWVDVWVCFDVLFEGEVVVYLVYWVVVGVWVCFCC